MAPSLDDEIESLEARVASLKKQLDVQTSTLISSESTRQLLAPAKETLLALPGDSDAVRQEMLSRSDAQQAHNQQCLYRACASVTAFKVRDPDPHAVDGGSVLGVRFEAMTRAKFLRPYYVMLNRPYASSQALRVHRHTVPPCIPLSGLAARHLPPPAREGESGDGADAGRRQDLSGFVRALRREIARHHNRTAVVGDLRKAVGLDGKRGAADPPADDAIVDVSVADTEAKQIKVEWADGRTGRLVMGDDGDVLNLVVFGERGRDRETARELLGNGTRVEDITRRLSAA